MITFSTLLDEYIDHTKDGSATNAQRGMRKMNALQKRICASNPYWWLEKNWTQATVAAQGTYDLPVDYRKLKTVRQSHGTLFNVLTEIVDPVQFNQLNYSQISTGSQALYYHLEGKKITFYPTPNTIEQTIYSYIARPVDMTMIDYTEGNILTLANGGVTVIGVGTLWTMNVKAGGYLIIDDEAYQIATVVSNTELTLAQAYQGTSIGAAYEYIIGDLPLIPQDFADILWIAAVRDYYLKKEDKQTHDMYTESFYEVENRLKSSTNAKSEENIIQRGKLYPINPNLYPTIYP